MLEVQLARINNICLMIIAACALTFGLVYTKAILIPFVISFFLYAISSPAIMWFEKKLKWPRMLSALATIILFLACMSIVTIFVIFSLKGFIAGADVYMAKLVKFFDDVVFRIESFGIEIDEKIIREELLNLPLLSYLRKFTGSIMSLVGNSTLVLIITSFLIAGEGVSKQSHEMVTHIHKQISHYVSAKFLLSFITSFLVGLILWFFNVELAFMFAILTFMLNFIPNIGSIVATLIPLPIVLLQFDFGAKFILVLVLTLLVQFIIGNIVEPKMMGESMDLHPVTVLMFLMFWGLVWGIPGMFLAVPITSIMKIIFSKIEATRFLSELMAGRIST